MSYIQITPTGTTERDDDDIVDQPLGADFDDDEFDPDDTGTSDSISTQQSDVVGIYDSNFQQVIQSARPMRATVQIVARTMDHPVESGGVRSDWRVILPIEITIPVFISGSEYRATYQSIYAIFNDTQLLTVRTKTGSYGNMLLSGIPHEESAEDYDLIRMVLHFRQMIVIDTQFQALSPEQAGDTDQSTVSRGEQQPQGTIALDVAKKLGFFNK